MSTNTKYLLENVIVNYMGISHIIYYTHSYKQIQKIHFKFKGDKDSTARGIKENSITNENKAITNTTNFAGVEPPTFAF